ncbi:hypothetical protein PghCCS26_61540 [Paenibacillus glycanilyticus]|uniref:Uncharacterized protein n=1 Tax=Paenibacillus glycanilyticus TaxID=126569 RepID=A0ABQ6NWW6_9BACL|nr:DUF5693 family protein [Paenibacillus glycanilyticus]GMK49024.1 hypothetical protein PghCCS26_61540 [Paenibacillus glycanilyticus]
MLQRWQQWNRKAILWLWVIAIIGVIAALPIGMNRMNMEASSKSVEYVFDYRDLVEISEYQTRPQQFIDEQLEKMKGAGITTMSLYESSLKELSQAGRLKYYSSKDIALLQSKLEPVGQNFTYILFSGTEEEEKIGPIIRQAMDHAGATYRPWSFDGRNGLVVEMPLQSVLLQPMDFDPITLQTLHDKGFHILARFSDRVLPYDEAATDAQLARLKEVGVTRVLFDGATVKGFKDQVELHSLNSFAELLNKYGMGITTIENLKKPQSGINKLAYITNYNIVRLYSLSAEDAIGKSPEVLTDRFLLAAKDRNIRMFFLNASVQTSLEKSAVVSGLDNLYITMKGKDGLVQRMTDEGFSPNLAQPFDVKHPSYIKPLKMVVAAGAVALIALLINVFIPGTLIPLYLIGLVGAAGLFQINSPLAEQALALGAGISAPTLALVWVMNRVYSRTEGSLRTVGGAAWNGRAGAPGEGKWVFEGLTVGRRLGLAVIWFIVTALISLMAVPFVFGLLNNITYSMVLQQFRGVSLLHLAPIGLTAIYVLLYTGNSPVRRIRKFANMPITVFMVVAFVVIAVVGMYYLSRTGNEGSASSLELTFRNWLEQTFGVRPRSKEFLLAHPLLLAGLFLALRYRAAWVFIIVGSIGQLSMVDTFAHIHTPLYISIIRVFLGLGLGAIIGLILIGVWQVVEGVWRKWSPGLIKKITE